MGGADLVLGGGDNGNFSGYNLARRDPANHTNDALGNNKSETLPHRLLKTAADNRISRVTEAWEWKKVKGSRRKRRMKKRQGRK